MTIRLLVVCLERITLPICSFFLPCSVHCERLVSSLQPVVIPSLSFLLWCGAVHLCTLTEARGTCGYPLFLCHSPLCSFEAGTLPAFLSLSLSSSLRLAARKSQQLSCLQPFSSGATGMCRTRSSFCLGTGIQMAVFIPRPPLDLRGRRLNPGPCAHQTSTPTLAHIQDPSFLCTLTLLPSS